METAKPEFLWFCGCPRSGDRSIRPANRMILAASDQPNSRQTEAFETTVSPRNRVVSNPQWSTDFEIRRKHDASKPYSETTWREVPAICVAYLATSAFPTRAVTRRLRVTP